MISRALVAGLIVGALDITAACLSAYLLSGAAPGRVLRFVASGALGEEAFSGGTEVAALGLFFHFVIAMSWTVAFFLLAPKVRFFSEHKFLAGLGYGLFIWLMMTFVVVPLSRVPLRPFNVPAQAIQVVIHMVLIGLTISLLANRRPAGAR